MSPVIAEGVVPPLREMQQEPAWPSILADHQPQDWPVFGSAPKCYQDLVHLRKEKALNSKSAQAIQSFYSFMVVCLT